MFNIFTNLSIPQLHTLDCRIDFINAIALSLTSSALGTMRVWYFSQFVTFIFLSDYQRQPPTCSKWLLVADKVITKFCMRTPRLSGIRTYNFSGVRHRLHTWSLINFHTTTKTHKILWMCLKHNRFHILFFRVCKWHQLGHVNAISSDM